MTDEQKWMWFQIALHSWSWRTPFAWGACAGAVSVAAAILLPGGGAPERDAWGRTRARDEWVPPENSADVAHNQRVAENRSNALFTANLTMWLLLAGVALIAVGMAPFVMLSE